jgi:hypothetical protein
MLAFLLELLIVHLNITMEAFFVLMDQCRDVLRSHLHKATTRIARSIHRLRSEVAMDLGLVVPQYYDHYHKLRVYQGSIETYFHLTSPTRT